MVRGVIVVFFTIFVVMLGLFVGIGMLEPLRDQVEKFDSIDEGELSGSEVNDDVFAVVFEYMPLIVIGGILLWAFRWYMRQERFVGRR